MHSIQKSVCRPMTALGLAVLLAGAAQAQAIVSTQLNTGTEDWYTPASTFDVAIAVTANPNPADFPLSCDFRIEFPSDSVTFVGVTEGDLGAPLAGPVELVSGTTMSVDVVTNGINTGTSMPNSSIATPTCFTAQFQVVGTPVFPYSITVDADPDASRPLPENDPPTFPNIPHSYDVTATLSLMDFSGVADWMILDQ